MKRTLTLKREDLTALSLDELGAVAGGDADAFTGQPRSCPLADCANISRLFVMTCACQSYPNC